MKFFVSNELGVKYNHEVCEDGVLRTFPQEIVDDTINIRVRAKSINRRQAYTLWSLMMVSNYRPKKLKIPDVSGEVTTWDEIVQKAK